MNSEKSYYQEFHQIDLRMLGSFPDFRKLTAKQEHLLSKLQEIYLRNISKEISCDPIDSQKREIFVTSLWYAWVLLSRLHLKLTEVNEAYSGIFQNYPVPAYRGQSNADYEPIASIFHSGVDLRFEERSFEAFSFIFEQNFLCAIFTE